MIEWSFDMANTVTVSFKMSPEDYVVLEALAVVGNRTVSELCRDTVANGLRLHERKGQLASFFAQDKRMSETETGPADS
jgi:hypothetical protein